MLWPFILPIQITLAIWLFIVLASPFVAPMFKLREGPAFGLTILAAVLLFIPSCAGVMSLVNRVRFGSFHYATFNDIPDERSRRYLPPAATQIDMIKFQDGSGYAARYTISDVNFHGYLDELWRKYAQSSTISRDSVVGEGRSVDQQAFDIYFGNTGWQRPGQAIEYHSPSEADGGGAFYYFDVATSTVYQRTGFW